MYILMKSKDNNINKADLIYSAPSIISSRNQSSHPVVMATTTKLVSNSSFVLPRYESSRSKNKSTV